MLNLLSARASDGRASLNIRALKHVGGTLKPNNYLTKQLSSRGRKQSQNKDIVQYCAILYGQSSVHILQRHKKQWLVNLLSQSDPY